MFLGLRTAIYHVDDIAKGKAWYAQVLGFEPYFDQPFYVGFNVGGYELGLQPSEGPAGEKADGAVAYCGGVRSLSHVFRKQGIYIVADPITEVVAEGAYSIEPCD
jgi:lactoylglutathione lyase